MKKLAGCLSLLLCLLLGCDGKPWNDPYPDSQVDANILYSSFSERPKTLDPARSYSSAEYVFITQIYEPPLQYDYFARPYQLTPLTATAIPQAEYYSANDQRLAQDAKLNDIAYTIYRVSIKPNIFYQPHPAFAKDEQGQYLYHAINDDFLESNHITRLADFKQTGTRELTADDYVYQIKRLAHPETQSPILGLMSQYIVGLQEYAEKMRQLNQLKNEEHQGNPFFLDLRKFPLTGVKVVDRYSYEIKIKGKYPQFTFWLAMPFFSPMPWEADYFDSQPGMKDNNLTLAWYPVGTGPYMLTENNPNRAMIMSKNPNFHGETFPVTGPAEDVGKAMPFIDEVLFSLEKETIPRWNKFLQGYYDNSGISSDSFDQAIKVDANGDPILTQVMIDRGIRLQTSIEPSIFYMGFNMLDPTVGGNSQRQKKLRQAISIAVDYEEYIAIFMNGRGIPAQGPIPPGIFGYEDGEKAINPIVYQWVNGHAKRRSLDDAKKLMRQAGYPNGRDVKTGKPLILNYDVVASSGPDDKARFDWMRKQFAKLGIQLHIRATQYNRFQEKMRRGDAQIFIWGWNADYPDPENFLFLLYGPSGKVKFGGENAANYINPEYDRLFDQMKNMDNTPQRLAIIEKMLKILREDAPWMWGFNPKTFVLSHQWNRAITPNPIANNNLKYAKLNPTLRNEKRQQWNQPVIWPIGLALLLFLISALPVVIHYWQKEHKRPRG